MELKSFSEFVNEAKSIKVPHTRGEKISTWWGGLNNPKTMRLGSDTVIEQILHYLYLAGDEGRTWKELHKFIIVNLKGMSDTRDNRGYYSSFFTKFLPRVAHKTKDKKWVLDNEEVIKYFKEIEAELKSKGLDRKTIELLDTIGLTDVWRDEIGKPSHKSTETEDEGEII